MSLEAASVRTEANPPRRFAPAAWRFLLGFFRGRAGAVAVCILAALGQSLAPLPMVPLVRLAVDTAIPRGDIGLLLAIAAGLAVLRLLAGAAAVATRSRVSGLKSRVILELRRDLFEGLYRRPQMSHVRAETQPLAGHLVIDAERVDALIDQGLGTALPALLTGLALAGALVVLNAGLVLVGLALLPLVGLTAFVATRRMGANYARYHDAHDAFMRGVRFVLDNFALTRARAAEGAEVARQAETLERLRAVGLRLTRDNSLAAQAQSGVLALVGLAILIAGAIAVQRHALSLGGLLAFLAAAGLASSQLDRLISTLPALVEGSAALSRLWAFTAATPPPPYSGARALDDWSGRVALEDVTFGYGGGPVLRNVSLALDPGERIGLTGANGAGKTTLFNLILGLYRPDAGRLTADGAAYEDLDLAALRRQVGIVPQEPVFFDGSVLENIAYGVAGVSRESIHDLAERIGASPLLARLPGGLDAPLGERGLRLSGGERQLVAILRALIARPRLLLLDEPTNHLDPSAMAGVLAGLGALSERPGLMIISHDPGALAGLDAVWRLEMGALTRVS